MKSLTILVGMTLCLALSIPSAFAKDTKKKAHAITAVADDDSIVETQAAEHHYSSSHTFGIGIMTGGLYPFVTPAGTISGSALAAEFNVSSADNIQPFMGIESTNNFTWQLGAIYRHTLLHTENSGFHLGGTVALGTNANAAPTQGNPQAHVAFNAAFGPVAGFHFSVPSVSNIVFFFDGGMLISINDGTANFAMQGLSPTLGLTVAYLF